MCSIVASFDKNKFIELMKLNSYRGNFSYSVLCFNYVEKKIISIYKSFGIFDENILKNIEDGDIYFIGHQQSPTGGLIKDEKRIHPSIINNSYLYHNGMLKNNFLQKYDYNNKWDTELLHKLINDDIKNLNLIEGSYSCLYIKENGDILLFRNQLSPLYIDKNLNISSTVFESSNMTEYNVIYRLDFNNKNIIEVNKINNNECIYFLN